MDTDKKKKLESAGSAVGDAQQFLQLSDEGMALIESMPYNPGPPRRSYTVQAVVVEHRRGVPAPFEPEPE